jgi:hypothetical protein
MERAPSPWHETYIAAGTWIRWLLLYYAAFGQPSSDEAAGGRVEIKAPSAPPEQE